MLRFVYFVGSNLVIDCDPTKYSQKGHGGYLANDPIDDTKVNVKYEVVRRENSSVYEDFVHGNWERAVSFLWVPLLVISTILG